MKKTNALVLLEFFDERLADNFGKNVSVNPAWVRWALNCCDNNNEVVINPAWLRAKYSVHFLYHDYTTSSYDEPPMFLITYTWYQKLWRYIKQTYYTWKCKEIEE